MEQKRADIAVCPHIIVLKTVTSMFLDMPSHAFRKVIYPALSCFPVTTRQPRRAIPTTKLRFVAENARNDLIIRHDAQFSEQISVSCKYKYKKTENAIIAASASVFPSLVWSATALPRHQGTMQRHQGTKAPRNYAKAPRHYPKTLFQKLP